MRGAWVGMGLLAMLLAPGAMALDVGAGGAAGSPAPGACDAASAALAGIAIDEPGVLAACTAAGDLDGDGAVDAAKLLAHEQAHVLQATATAACGNAAKSGVPGYDVCVAAADLDGDGLLDLALAQGGAACAAGKDACAAWGSAAGLARKGHDIAMNAISNIRA